MNKLLVALGRSFGLLGIVACVVAILARGAGQFWIAGFPSGTLLQGGVAAIVIAVFFFVAK